MLWKAISERWAAFGALGGSFASGALLVLVLGGFVGLPAQHTEDVERLDSRIEAVENAILHLDILVCVLTNEHLDRPVEDCVNS